MKEEPMHVVSDFTESMMKRVLKRFSASSSLVSTNEVPMRGTSIIALERENIVVIAK